MRVVAVEHLVAAKVAAAQGAAVNELYPNRPNPFNASTRIAYSLAAGGRVRLEIYNVLGQAQQTLVDQVQAAGVYQVSWNGRDQRGAAVAAGVYLVRLSYPGGGADPETGLPQVARRAPRPPAWGKIGFGAGATGFTERSAAVGMVRNVLFGWLCVLVWGYGTEAAYAQDASSFAVDGDWRDWGRSGPGEGDEFYDVARIPTAA